MENYLGDNQYGSSIFARYGSSPQFNFYNFLIRKKKKIEYIFDNERHPLLDQLLENEEFHKIEATKLAHSRPAKFLNLGMSSLKISDDILRLFIVCQKKETEEVFWVVLDFKISREKFCLKNFQKIDCISTKDGPMVRFRIREGWIRIDYTVRLRGARSMTMKRTNQIYLLKNLKLKYAAKCVNPRNDWKVEILKNEKGVEEKLIIECLGICEIVRQEVDLDGFWDDPVDLGLVTELGHSP